MTFVRFKFILGDGSDEKGKGRKKDEQKEAFLDGGSYSKGTTSIISITRKGVGTGNEKKKLIFKDLP